SQCLSNHLHTFRDHLSEGSVYSLSSFDFTRSNNYFRLSDSMMVRLSLKEPIQLSQYKLKCSGTIRYIVIVKYLDESLM
ncbi:unnamed protein product, partial [Brassica oleracea]